MARTNLVLQQLARPTSWSTGAAWLGNRTRLVPATDELIAELARYRSAHGLPPTPQPGETRPLVLPVIGRETGRDKASG